MSRWFALCGAMRHGQAPAPAALEAVTFAPTDVWLPKVLSAVALTQSGRDFGCSAGQEDCNSCLSDAAGPAGVGSRARRFD